MDGSVRVEICEHVKIREVGGECVILDLETEMYFGLDEIGTEVLRCFRAGSSVAEAVSQVVSQYDATPEEVASDVEALLRSLVDRGLVRTVDTR